MLIVSLKNFFTLNFFCFSLLGQVSTTDSLGLLDSFVVIERRTPESLIHSSPWVTRIANEDLEIKQLFTLSEALRSVPGMAVVRTGQLGSQTSVFSRGGESNHIAYLYEGRKLNGGFSGTYNLGELSTLGSSSIEILRGSSSHLYGAHAMGGTVYLRNKLPEEEGTISKVELATGSNKNLRSGYNTSVKNKDLSANFGLLTYETENDRLNSKLENISSSFHIKKDFQSDWSINFIGLGYQSNLGLPGSIYSPSSDNFQETEQFLISPQVELGNDDWNFLGTYSLSEDELYYFSPGYRTISWTTQEDIDVLLDWSKFDFMRLNLGFTFSTQHFRQDGFQPASMWGPVQEWDRSNTLEQISSFVSINYDLSENNEIDGSIRYDDYSDFDNPLTFNFQLKNILNKNLSSFIKFSTGYAPPTALELYGIDGRTGNPSLLAEKSVSYELALKFINDEQRDILGMSLFRTDYKNLIAGYPLALNINRSRVSGLEISYESLISGNISFTSSLSYLKSENKDSGERFLDRRPKFLGFVSLSYLLNSFSIGSEITMKFNTKEKDWSDWSSPTYGSFIDADDFVITSFFSNYKFSDDVHFFSRIDNIFNEVYEEVDGYPALGINLSTGFRYIF